MQNPIPHPAQGDPSTADRILLRLKTRGPAAASELAGELEMTAEAARQQLQKLAADGLIAGRQAATPVRAGRPRQEWELTATGHARFPDTHAQLTVQLIGSIRQLFGQPGLDKLIGQREAEMGADYRQRCAGLPSLSRKLEKLAEIRSAEGYMARVEKQGKDWLLIEDHCPICAAAQTCQGFCRSELQLFGEVLGADATISREEHLLAGARRCVYRIRRLAPD
ncbi:MAG TPA: metalloregulator ArsR/SmtB family transcription factor [Herbaspirillum sp.]|uniref:helix-turn-helix transcriptional regulator n=1 Tax=Herbaspirillum sp. TaxID=1890675 RepID=UPI002D30E0D8|nr:metalloregulator ArsR/SmtB family transcription factor [Herbaspirillum sp.]HZG22700.1 metalloregulator ArsR/SmtB family transcription factor [Herbaspirillum sp.]